MITNPDYIPKEAETLYKRGPIAAVGIELWQVKSGTIIDNIIVTDKVEEAEEFMKKTWSINKVKEKEMFDAAEKKKVLYTLFVFSVNEILLGNETKARRRRGRKEEAGRGAQEAGGREEEG